MTADQKSRSLLLITGAGAEITWLYAWASFLLINCFQRVYPLPETIAAFSSAALLTLYPRGRGWRVIQVIGVHLIGLVCACLWIIHTVYHPFEPFWSRGWLTAFFHQQRGHLEWFLLVFVLGYTVTFWIAGILFARQTPSYHSACVRFDRGLTALFFLFLIKLMFHTQCKVQFHDSMTVLLVFPFFIFGLTGIGLARNHGAPKGFLKGYRTTGVLAGFVLGTLVLGAGVFLLFLPYLTSASVVGYEWLKGAARPLAPILIALIRFIFGHSKAGPANPDFTPGSPGADIVPVGETSGWLLWVEKILIWGGAGLLVIALFAGICFGLWYGVRWLFSRQSGDGKDRTGWGITLLWNRLKRWFYRVYGWTVQRKETPNAVRYYSGLLRWGRYSGLPHEPNETPREYGLRLVNHFPRLRDEIRFIVEMFQYEVYGEKTLCTQELWAMRQALTKMHTPWVWPLRVKSLFHSA